MTTVRIFVPTYRRPRLLPRALESLRGQTFTGWVAEVHNDDPADPEPARIVARLADPRINLVTHPRNLGGTATFNLFFRPTAEPFYAMLEDDNWWEPDFLATMLEAAARHPAAVVFWANQRLWEEQPGGGWRNTGRTTWPAGEGTREFAWGQPAQICGALHAHGAALFRSRPGDDFSTPAVPIAVTEPFRERMLPHPLVLVQRPVAHFALTLETARSRDPAEWAELQAMLAATFFRDCPWPADRIAAHWAGARAQNPPATTNLILAALAAPGALSLAHATPRDWWLVLRGLLRRPGLYFRLRRSRRVHADWWRHLEEHTAARWAARPPGRS
jgi:hypothetical protein